MISKRVGVWTQWRGAQYNSDASVVWVFIFCLCLCRLSVSLSFVCVFCYTATHCHMWQCVAFDTQIRTLFDTTWCVKVVATHCHMWHTKTSLTHKDAHWHTPTHTTTHIFICCLCLDLLSPLMILLTTERRGVGLNRGVVCCLLTMLLSIHVVVYICRRCVVVYWQ